MPAGTNRSAAGHPRGSEGVQGPRLQRRTFLHGLGAVALGGGGLLSGCGDRSGTQAGGQSGDQAGETTGGLTVTDQRGETISLPAPATRIVTLPMPAASLLIAVDQGADHLVGMHDASWVAIRDGIMADLFPAALEVPHGVADEAFAPNVESIATLEPDVVVQWGDIDDGLIAPLTNAGLQVAGLTGRTQEDVAAWITLFAALLGKPERGEQINARIADRYRQAQELAAGRQGPGPRILYFNRFLEDRKVAATQTSDDFYITLIGATNAATGEDGVGGSGMVGVDTEQVLAWDPDIILLGNFDTAVPDDLYSDPVWSELSAVRSRQVYKVPLGGYRWDPPSHESPLMWTWVAQVAYPGSGSVDLHGQIREHYDLLYGQSPTDAQIEGILWREANAGSANYEQFDAS